MPPRTPVPSPSAQHIDDATTPRPPHTKPHQADRFGAAEASPSSSPLLIKAAAPPVEASSPQPPHPPPPPPSAHAEPVAEVRRRSSSFPTFYSCSFPPRALLVSYAAARAALLGLGGPYRSSGLGSDCFRWRSLSARLLLVICLLRRLGGFGWAPRWCRLPPAGAT
ncbi:hypothetical protein PVAP13_5NG589872 [Panicum virgatum]|uniref:Uncharacterized protein n=1 Tax=Panicum virgatum TaxID=38727 RepID=A0A8T0S379_PANVG|nr:hypothetical protein PVAP13_5NG589872 [Panicum virgatum]